MPLGGRSLDPSNDQTFSAHLQPLISRNYKGDVAMSEIDHFMPLLIQKVEVISLRLRYGIFLLVR